MTNATILKFPAAQRRPDETAIIRQDAALISIALNVDGTHNAVLAGEYAEDLPLAITALECVLTAIRRTRPGTVINFRNMGQI